ncbi:hypothetical protein ACOXXE_07530 [Pseudomonas mediterranea]|uniref:hypothetical protein n=1 Tax=Pseudomonas mediterranea TaxID=183795 RepID=UPI003BF54A8D
MVMSVIREGVVVGGEYVGWKIFIDDDRDGDSGGYYLYLKKSDGEGFDYWFEQKSRASGPIIRF